MMRLHPGAGPRDDCSPQVMTMMTLSPAKTEIMDQDIPVTRAVYAYF
jgi:hypothetical protein